MKGNGILKAGDNYRGYTLPANRRHKEYNQRTADQLVDLIDSWTAWKTRVVGRRIDIRSPDGCENPLTVQQQTRLFERVKKNILHREKAKGKDGTIGWLQVSEQSAADKNPHWHVLIFADGDAFKNGHGICEEFTRQLQKQFGEEHSSLVELGQSALMDRNSEGFAQQKQKVFEMGIYLAKTATKEHREKWDRFSSRSQLPPIKRK